MGDVLVGEEWGMDSICLAYLVGMLEREKEDI